MCACVCVCVCSLPPSLSFIDKTNEEKGVGGRARAPWSGELQAECD